jgi:hypothetical protein
MSAANVVARGYEKIAEAGCCPPLPGLAPKKRVMGNFPWFFAKVTAAPNSLDYVQTDFPYFQRLEIKHVPPPEE